MNPAPAIIRRSPTGMSLLEVMLAAVVLTVCATALLSASYTSTTANQQSGEYAAAVSAARLKMEELSSCAFDKLVERYGKDKPTIGNTFKVYLNESPEYKFTTSDANGTPKSTKMRGVELPGFRKQIGTGATAIENFDAGEIVIVIHESNLPSSYGYSCSTSAAYSWPDGGQPGGISFGLNNNGIPIDLNGDGNTTSGNCYNILVTPQVRTAKRLPVGVIVRWNGPHGPERYELWTIMSIY